MAPQQMEEEEKPQVLQDWVDSGVRQHLEHKAPGSFWRKSHELSVCWVSGAWAPARVGVQGTTHVSIPHPVSWWEDC